MADDTDNYTITDLTMRHDRAIAEGGLSLPRRFGRYEVLSRIGVGGFASVYSARDPELDSSVAVKVLADNHAADVEVRKRFVAEARVARRLSGDRLIDVFDLGETDDGRPFVVMELATGGTLRDRLNKIGRPSPESLLRLISELGSCMAAIHHQDVVHRDIKPRNLLLRRVNSGHASDGDQPSTLIDDNERLVLADFGLARDISAGASGVTVGGGTAGYMAPEQADPEGKADFRADIYAASVVLAELTTGRHPERLDLGTANLTPEVRSAIEQGLSVDRGQRPSSAEAWTARLLHAYRSGGPYNQVDLVDSSDGADDRDGDDQELTNRLVITDTGRSNDQTNLIDPTAIIDPGHMPRPGRPESSTDVQLDSTLGESALGGEGLELRTFVKPLDDDSPPPPPPSIPLSSKIQRPAPDKTPPRQQAQTHEPPAAEARADKPHPPKPLTPKPLTPEPTATKPLTPEPTATKPDPPSVEQRPLAPQRPKQRAFPVGPPSGEVPADPQRGRQARQQQKLVRKDARKRRRRRQRRKISNVFRALIRAVLSTVLTLVIGSIVAVAYTEPVTAELATQVDDLSVEAKAIVQLAAFVAFFIGMRYFPWPRRLDPNG